MSHALLLVPDFLLILCGFVLCRWTALEPQRLGRRGAAGVLPAVPGAAVQLDPQVAAAAGRDAEPGRGRRGGGRGRRAAGLCAAAVSRRRCARACLGGADRLPLQFLHRAGAGRAPGRAAGPGLDRAADRAVRAAVQRGRGVAAGAAWRPWLPARDRAQPADPGHRGRVDRQPGRAALSRRGGLGAAAHRPGRAAAGADGGGRGLEARRAEGRARPGRGLAVDPPCAAAAAGHRLVPVAGAAAGAEPGAGAVRGAAHRAFGLCAGGAHGRPGAFRRRAGDAVDAAVRARPAAVAGGAGGVT